MPTEQEATAADNFAEFEAKVAAADAPEPEQQDEGHGGIVAEEIPAQEETSEREPELPLGDTEREKKPRTTSERINKLTADMRHFERIVEAERAEKAALKAEIEALKAGKPLTPEKEADKPEAVEGPNPEKYRYGELDPQYMTDLADHRANLIVAKHMEALRKDQEDAQRRSAADRETDQLREKAAKVQEAGASKFSDFEDVVVEGAKAGNYELTKEMLETAMETSVGPEVLYHLAKNPEESRKVSEMNLTQMAMWFGRMEGKLTAAPKAPERKAPSAPDPVAPARGSSGQFSTSPATEDFAAFERLAAAAAKG